VIKFMGFGDNSSSRVQNKLKTIGLCRLSRRVTTINFRAIERSITMVHAVV